MSNQSKDINTPGMDPREDEALWRLLGRSKNAEVGPYFSRRVLREVTLAGENRRASASWLTGLGRLLRRPRAAAVWPGAVVVAGFWLAVVMTTPPSGQGHAGYRPWQTPPVAGQRAASVSAGAEVDDQDMAADDITPPDDVEVIADLDNMIVREENRLWTEEDTARF